MATPSASSREKVFAAAQQLEDAGKNPTMDGIRELIGGSFTTISPLLKEWKLRKVEQAKLAPLPALVSERLQAMGADLWSAAIATANGALAAERERLTESLAEMEGERDEAIRLADGLTQEVSELRERLTEAAAKEALVIEREQRMQEQADRSARDAQVAQARVDEMQRSQEVLRDELNRAHAEVEKERGRAAEAREAFARLSGQHEGSKGTVKPKAGR
jgi:chromosome segregation ATPase